MRTRRFMSRSRDVIAIIPSRYGSTRFPGKPLAMISGRPMIEHVYRAAVAALGRAVVATDDERIAEAVRGFGGEAVMTSADCPNGTARVIEAYRKLGRPAGVVVNVQGDEPFILPGQIASVAQVLADNPEAQIATLALRFDPAEGFESLFDPNRVKMVRDAEGRALYFSRSIVPYVRDVAWQEWIDRVMFYIHVGLYAYRGEVLESLAGLEPSPLDRAENLEQLRWLHHGYTIHTAVTTTRTYPIDTPADLEKCLHIERQDANL